MEGNKLITIISSTYNAEDTIQTTIHSIRNQTYTNFEWIIVDGKSSDNTVKIIKQNTDIITFWLSEKDEGIYDAWNKAIKQIKGDWVIFLGAGDKFYSKSVLHNFSKHLINNDAKDLIYGKTQVVSEDLKSVLRMWGKPWSEMKDKWETIRPALPPHPSSFIRSSVFIQDLYEFPVEYKIAGDSHLLMTLIKQREPLFIPLVVDVMPTGGVSSLPKNQFKVLKEIKKLNEEFNIITPFKVYVFALIKICMFKILSMFFKPHFIMLVSKK